jgi:hypothetical protein
MASTTEELQEEEVEEEDVSMSVQGEEEEEEGEEEPSPAGVLPPAQLVSHFRTMDELNLSQICPFFNSFAVLFWPVSIEGKKRLARCP